MPKALCHDERHEIPCELPCDACSEECAPSVSQPCEPSASPLIGFQVADDNGEMPDNMFSFEIFSLSTCLRVIATDNKRWRLLPIHDGDVEEPSNHAVPYAIDGLSEFIQALEAAGDLDAFQDGTYGPLADSYRAACKLVGRKPKEIEAPLQLHPCPNCQAVQKADCSEHHQLRIKSLRDLIAECTCDNWSFIAPTTDHDSSPNIRSWAHNQYAFHLSAIAKGRRRKETNAIAQNIWDTLNANERHGASLGLFPQEKMITPLDEATAAGYDQTEITCAIMKLAKAA